MCITNFDSQSEIIVTIFLLFNILINMIIICFAGATDVDSKTAKYILYICASTNIICSLFLRPFQYLLNKKIELKK